MTLRDSSRYRKWPALAMRTLPAILLGLLASLPAGAAEHPASALGLSSSNNDPFAAYDASLNEAATTLLQKAAESGGPNSAMSSTVRPEMGTSPAAVLRNNADGGLQRVERLRPILEPILHKAGVPAQLMAVVLVESDGNPTALSPKGARGLWQLMPDTARRYGLTVNAEKDQRLNIVKSTRAAADYLRDLYADFHNWELALAAYNAGQKAVEQAMERTGGTSFSAAAPALPSETQHYVPSVLNAIPMFGGAMPAQARGEMHLQDAVYATLSQ